MITVSTALLAAVAKWAYADHSEPLGMVLFGDGRIVATDAHRLVIVPCPEATTRFGIWRDHILAAVAAQDSMARVGVKSSVPHDTEETDDGYLRLLTESPRGHRKIDIDIEDEFVRLRTGGVDVMATIAPAAKYPTSQVIDALFVNDNAGTPNGYALDAHYLAAISEVIAASATNPNGIRVTQWSALHDSGMRGPIILDSEDGVRFVIMPRLNGSLHAMAAS